MSHRQLRLSRTRATLVAFVIGLALGSSLVTSGEAHERQVTRSARSSCGTWPDVAMRNDCYLKHHRREARIWWKQHGRCIAEAEASSRHQSGPYYGELSLGLSAWESVGPDRFDSVHPLRSRRLYLLKARRLHAIRGVSPWPPARHC